MPAHTTHTQSDCESEAPASVHTTSPDPKHTVPERPAIAIPSTQTNSNKSNALGPRSAAGVRFRTSVHKVMHLHRSSTAMFSRGGAGAEPGVDPRRPDAAMQWGHIKEKCVIEVVDYSSTRRQSKQMNNNEFVSWLLDKSASKRESWAKVRWINVGGISWDVLSQLALTHDLHPLALETMLIRQTGHALSKVDYYVKHLFLHVLCHTIADEDDDDIIKNAVETTSTSPPRSSSPMDMTMAELDKEPKIETDRERTAFISKISTASPPMRKRKTRAPASLLQSHRESAILPGHNYQADHKRTINEMTIKQLKKHDRVNVDVKSMFMFLTRDGTVISVHPTPNLVFTSAIAARLRPRDTGLRMTADASLLLESLLDLIVDQTLEVVEAFQAQILMLERQVLIKPKIQTVRSLHILSGDIILRKRTLEPIRSLIYGLRRYDLDRCMALIDPSKTGGDVKVEGFMSSKSKIYLADVFDHMEYTLASLDMTANVTENLIDYTFNQSSYDTNQVMRRLTLVTVTSLPLTFLTGYFGMNFQYAPVHSESDAVFWYIAVPLMAVILPAFLWSDLVNLAHYMSKKHLASHVGRDIQLRRQ